jgi:hypothetical protein
MVKQVFHATLMIALLLWVAGCSNKKETVQEERSLYDRVMDVHDEVMPSMGELNRLKRELADKINNASDLPREKREALEATVLKIDSASRSMMVWMREFNPEDFTGEEQQQYLENEMKRIQEVKSAMLEALDEGRKANQ